MLTCAEFVLWIKSWNSASALARFNDAANTYLVNLTSDEIAMPTIVRLEALMGSAMSMVHPTIKVIYETMSEFDTADIRLDGINKLLDYPEYSDTGKLKNLLGVLEEKDKLLDVISKRNIDDGINVYIGKDEDGDAMSDTTMIFKTINVGGKKVAFGVIGPKRMNYSKVIGMIHSLASGIDQMFNSTPDALTDGEHDNTNGGYFGEGK